MTLYKKYFSFIFAASISMQSNVFAKEKYLRTEALLAGINFSLGTIGNRLDFNKSEDRENIKKIEIARSLIRTMLDVFKIRNHNDRLAGLLWLVSDSLTSIDMINNYSSSSLDKKPLFKCHGVYDAVEAASLIYASYIQPLDTDPLNKNNIEATINVECASLINSLARLINTNSPKITLITLNIILLCLAQVGKSFFMSNIDKIYIPNNEKMENLDFYSQKMLDQRLNQ